MAEKDLIAERQRKLKALYTLGIYPYGRRFDRTALAAEVNDNSGPVRLAGRITALRSHGKAAFGDLSDISGVIQVYFQKDVLGPEFEVFLLLDIGDIIGVEGEPFRTRTGQVTVKSTKLVLLSKSNRPLPEKWHGLKDVETRFRQRYLDLIANQEVRNIFLARSSIISRMRQYLNEQGFLEVETPMMHPIPGGAEARPFITHHNTLDMDLYLRIAPELYLKRLLVGGLEKVYEINRSFRNEGISTLHNPEFTMLELYQAYGDYETMAEIAQGLILSLVPGPKSAYQGKEIDLTPPWRRVTLEALVKNYLGVSGWYNKEELARSAVREGIPLTGEETNFDLLDSLFKVKIQPDLIAPTFVLDYPKEISPLAKSKPDNEGVVERFELFIGGLEVGNAYSELNDPEEQRRRFEEKVMQNRPDLSLHVSDRDRLKVVDEDYVIALSYGMPPAGGLGIGIDRLVMLLTGCISIREVVLFPLLRPER
ncbi:MAG: lysine--tRNA ligase [bacterium (Candidatus Ratteibacteria) CG23_combo_of_CG06-09_8_20_14_all_48_7]|uniref:Lysine--tRNA ligase n=1 Tax=bacterium (Candidatus Ratteibacteria) CG23_combo_of_CG06-09_8_20_14_all_48_7 TaxID=2014292 RepID=A0A2G9YAP9_9BACT|nr:MAG: lysine--tRNA ligase [bacterium (Candidatus Ratteibacteria) CG23_combo_of_CG06-09_8_20_14_all_48_7]